MFADYTYTNTPEATDVDGNLVHPSAFNVSRSYINITGNISHRIAFRVTPDLIELRNLVEVADLIIRCALARHESRGLHYTLDYPEMPAEAVDTVLVP